MSWNPIPDIIRAHLLVRDSGLPNYLGCRIPGNSNLNCDNWIHYLVALVATEENHKSALLNSSHVQKYISEKLSHKAILGPFKDKPIHLHTSPLMVRDKQDSTAKRTIMDLSWPQGLSVNHTVSKDMYLDTEFYLKYSSVDQITASLRNLGPGAMIYKIDISRAFRQIFQIYTDAIRFIMAQHGFPDLHNYIGDLMYTGLPSEIHKCYKFLTELLEKLGLDISVKKLVPPSTSVTCLGIQIDTVNRTISIPPEKLKEIVVLCKDWASKTYCSKKDLQSLIGSLLYITKCVARSFLNRMLHLL